MAQSTIRPILDGYILSQPGAGATWAQCREVATGAVANSTSTHFVSAVWAGFGKSQFSLSRTFMSFDVQDMTECTAATLKLYGHTNSSAAFFVVKATHGATLTTADIDAIEGWDHDANNSSNVTYYSEAVSSWSTSGYNEITLTSAAITDINSDNTLYLCCIEKEYDLSHQEPSTDYASGMHLRGTSDSADDPLLVLTYPDPQSTYTSDDQISLKSGTLTLSSGTTTIK